MGKLLLSLLVTLLFLTDPLCYAQTSIQISDPRLELKNNGIYISYDILNSDPSDMFSILLSIKDEDGNLISANTVEGDIGEAVPGGDNKQIIWDFRADQIVINGDIYINISAEVIPPVIADSKDRKGKDVSTGTESGEFSRTGLIFQSVVFPGLGLSRLTGKPHWLRGVTGYGCVAGAVVMNRLAVSSYEDFKSAGTVEIANSALAESSSQDNLSDMLGYAALGIWISDFIWTLVGTSRLNDGEYSSDLNRISLNSGLDPLSNLPLVGITFRF